MVLTHEMKIARAYVFTMMNKRVPRRGGYRGRALVRAGGTGGMLPVNFSQRVAATHQIRQQ